MSTSTEASPAETSPAETSPECPPAPAPWQERTVGWLARRKRLSVVVPVVVLVLGTPHSCPLC